MTTLNASVRNVFAGPADFVTLTIIGGTTDTLHVERNGVVTTDYTLDGQVLTPIVPLAGGETLYVVRRYPFDQPYDDVENKALFATVVEGTIDRAARQVQQVADMVRRNVVGEKPTDNGSTIVVDAPVPSTVLVGASSTRLTGASISSLLGGSPVVLPVSSGGVGGTTPAASRAALGLGDVALLNSGAAPGNVPTLDGSGKVPPAQLPQLTSGAAGILPGYTANRKVYVANPSFGDPGWREVPNQRVGLKNASSSSTSQLDCRASGTEWDGFDAFEVEIYFVVTGTTIPTMTWDIGGSLITSGTYGYIIERGAPSATSGADTNSGTATSIPMADTTGMHGSVAKDMTFVKAVVTNPKALDAATTFSAAALFEWQYIHYTAAQSNLTVVSSARNSTTGYWRGLRMAMSSNTFAPIRIRVWGLRFTGF